MITLSQLDKQHATAVRQAEAAKKRGDKQAQSSHLARVRMLNQMILNARLAEARG